MLRRAWRELRAFTAIPRGFIVGGAALIWLLTNLQSPAQAVAWGSYASRIGQLPEPLLGQIGMTADLAVSLLFGFITKEILLGAMAVNLQTSASQLGNAILAAISPAAAGAQLHDHHAALHAPVSPRWRLY